MSSTIRPQPVARDATPRATSSGSLQAASVAQGVSTNRVLLTLPDLRPTRSVASATPRTVTHAAHDLPLQSHWPQPVPISSPPATASAPRAVRFDHAAPSPTPVSKVAWNQRTTPTNWSDQLEWLRDVCNERVVAIGFVALSVFSGLLWSIRDDDRPRALPQPPQEASQSLTLPGISQSTPSSSRPIVPSESNSPQELFFPRNLQDVAPWESWLPRDNIAAPPSSSKAAAANQPARLSGYDAIRHTARAPQAFDPATVSNEATSVRPKAWLKGVVKPRTPDSGDEHAQSRLY